MPALPNQSPSLWRPLKNPTFRDLLAADIVSDVGTFMQGVGAAWLMVSLNSGPMLIALTQTASSLPFFLLALPAGAIGDIVDRRKLILFTELWMLSVALILAGMTLAGMMSPLLLLALTFALSAGDAVEAPTWRAILPEVVAKEDLAAASALNGIEFNLARAIGPALAGFIIAVAGVGSAFLINAISFIGVILVILRWKRPIRKRTTPPESVSGATIAAIRYVRNSPQIRIVLVRSGFGMFFASALLALLPAVAHSVSSSPVGYGVLLGCFGAGAVVGALLMQRARARHSAEAVVAVGIAVFGLTTILIGSIHAISGLTAIMFAAGAAWIVFISLFNVLLLNLTPDWVRARVLAVSLLIFQGAVAGGSAAWGAVAARFGIHSALLWAGVGTLATTSLGLFMRLPEAAVDLTAWNHWRVPAIKEETFPNNEDAGPVLVTIEYEVAEERVAEFVEAMHRFGRIRRRDGASRWGIFRDLENPGRFVETFIVASWAEHLRQHDRLTQADRVLEDRVLSLARNKGIVHHLISAR